MPIFELFTRKDINTFARVLNYGATSLPNTSSLKYFMRTTFNLKLAAQNTTDNQSKLMFLKYLLWIFFMRTKYFHCITFKQYILWCWILKRDKLSIFHKYVLPTNFLEKQLKYEVKKFSIFHTIASQLNEFYLDTHCHEVKINMLVVEW